MVGIWFFGSAAWVFSMVLLGGVTRLTRFGLSMTDWKFTGSLPPLSNEEWLREFDKYKQSPEYKRQSLPDSFECLNLAGKSFGFSDTWIRLDMKPPIRNFFENTSTVQRLMNIETRGDGTKEFVALISTSRASPLAISASPWMIQSKTNFPKRITTTAATTTKVKDLWQRFET
ncbi:cytochrome c oxidase assembly protein cox15 [Quercus suber]|uniref:Cytochrome c oxidase assembly protein cox15 n=1 Tax=Quercus suber TaxID=58331 RepID=A0AAW0LRY4_QUESU